MSQNVIPDAAEAKLKVLSVSPSTQKKAKKDQLPSHQLSLLPSAYPLMSSLLQFVSNTFRNLASIFSLNLHLLNSEGNAHISVNSTHFMYEPSLKGSFILKSLLSSAALLKTEYNNLILTMKRPLTTVLTNGVHNLSEDASDHVHQLAWVDSTSIFQPKSKKCLFCLLRSLYECIITFLTSFSNDSVIPSILGTFFLQFGVSLSETNPPSVDSSTFLIDLAASLKSKLTIASFGVLADSIIQFITFFKQSAEELEDETFEATEILEHADQDLAINSVLQPDQLTVNVSDVPDALVFSRRDIIHSHDENAPEINADIVEATISKWCADNERTEIQGDLVKEVMDKCQQWLDDKVEPAEDYDLSAKKENRCQVTFETKEDDEEEEEEESKEEEEEDFNEGEGQSEEEEDREEKEDSGNGNNEDGFSHNSGESESSEEEATTPKTPLSTRRSQTSHKSVRSQRESKRENDPEKEDDMKEIEGDEDEPQTQRPPPTPVSRAGAMAGHSESEPQKLEEQVEDTAVDGEDVGKSTKTQDGTKANEKEEKQGQQKTTPQTRSVQTKSAEQRAMNEQKRKEMEKERAAKIQEQIRIKNQEKEQRMKEEKLRKEAEKKKKEEENKRKEEEARKRKNDLEKQKKERFLSEFKPKSNQPKHKPKLDDNQKNEILKIRKEFLDTFIDDTL